MRILYAETCVVCGDMGVMDDEMTMLCLPCTRSYQRHHPLHFSAWCKMRRVELLEEVIVE